MVFGFFYIPTYLKAHSQITEIFILLEVCSVVIQTSIFLMRNNLSLFDLFIDT